MANALIKRKNLLLILKKNRINKTKKKALAMIEKLIEKNTEKIIILLKEEMTTNGKKTLDENDVFNVVERIKKEEFGWEI